jgi:hypothetical protein
VHGTGTGLCSITGFGVSDAEPVGFVVRELIN